MYKMPSESNLSYVFSDKRTAFLLYNEFVDWSSIRIDLPAYEF